MAEVKRILSMVFCLLSVCVSICPFRSERYAQKLRQEKYFCITLSIFFLKVFYVKLKMNSRVKSERFHVCVSFKITYLQRAVHLKLRHRLRQFWTRSAEVEGEARAPSMVHRRVVGRGLGSKVVTRTLIPNSESIPGIERYLIYRPVKKYTGG